MTTYFSDLAVYPGSEFDFPASAAAAAIEGGGGGAASQ